MYDKARIDEETEYFEQVFALAEVGGYTAEEVVSEDAVAQYTTDPDQVEWDVWLLRSAVEDKMLPDEYQEEFGDMYGLKRQAEDMNLIRVPEIEEEYRDEVSEQVAREMNVDSELGFNTDFAHELYLRRYWGTKLQEWDR